MTTENSRTCCGTPARQSSGSVCPSCSCSSSGSVFGGMAVPATTTYREYLLPRVSVMTMLYRVGRPQTGMAADLNRGVVDRFARCWSPLGVVAGRGARISSASARGHRAGGVRDPCRLACIAGWPMHSLAVAPILLLRRADLEGLLGLSVPTGHGRRDLFPLAFPLRRSPRSSCRRGHAGLAATLADGNCRPRRWRLLDLFDNPAIVGDSSIAQHGCRWHWRGRSC